MTFKSFLAAAGATAALLATTSSALAQTAAPAAPVTIVQGPAIAGLCIFSPEQAMGASTVGQFVSTRLKQLSAQTQAELSAEKAAIDTDAKALDTARPTLDQNTFETRAAALQVRANALNRKAVQRDGELQKTQQKALGRIGNELEPLVRSTYESKKCSLLLSRQALIVSNPAMDITASVTAALNAKITQFEFNRETLTPQELNEVLQQAQQQQ